MSIIIKSFGKYVPEKVLTNDDLSKTLDTNDAWIRERTGMVERRIAADDELASDMACKAGLDAIEKAGLQKEDIDCLIIATCSGDQPSPSTACIAQNKMGLNGIIAFDILGMCSGFLYSLQVAESLVKTDVYKNILIIGVEKISQILDWTDRSTCILFGDGAGAAIVGKGDDGHELIGTYGGSDGKYSDLLEVRGRDSNHNSAVVQMKGKDLFKHAVRNLVQASKKVLEQEGFSEDEIDWIVPHQANMRILQTTAKKFDVPMEKVFINLEKYGNTSAASIPLALEEGGEKFKKGDLILCPAFGGGLTWAATLIRW
ncbi:MAG: 3-oxoacyl-ACP synthase [Planctomycetota bacterium]|nr:MAG: 3-oxoacyl-ACP synthase [Planctomycetota bacterium]